MKMAPGVTAPAPLTKPGRRAEKSVVERTTFTVTVSARTRVASRSATKTGAHTTKTVETASPTQTSIEVTLRDLRPGTTTATTIDTGDTEAALRHPVHT